MDIVRWSEGQFKFSGARSVGSPLAEQPSSADPERPTVTATDHRTGLLAEAEQLADFGVWSWSLRTGKVVWSSQLERIYGLAEGTFPGTVEAFSAFLHPEDRERVWAEVQRSIDAARPFIWQERIIRADGEQRVLISHGQPTLNADGTVAELVGVCHDVTARVQAESALGNIEFRMREIIENSPSLICIKDREHRYRMANQEFGRLLRLDPCGIVGRHVSDIFPGLAADLIANADRAAETSSAVHDELQFSVNGEARIFHTVTFPLPQRGDDGQETCTIATDVTEQRRREEELRVRSESLDLIASALDDGRMLVVAQPIRHIRTGTFLTDELLVRIRPADGGMLLGPDTFLPAAERYGLIQTVDAWMVKRALELAIDRSVSVNVSAVTLCDDAARELILKLLNADAAAAARIVFELTESAAATHIDAAARFGAAVTELGCGLSLDDFGTGFGSFTYLRRLPLRYLKIDRSFVTNLTRSADDRRVVRSIISIAEQYELRTIAEGVEDVETLAVLKQLGADYAQGELVGTPAPVGFSARRDRDADTA